MDKFGLVEMNCNNNAWSNNCTHNGKIALQNGLKGKSISEKTILTVFSGTPFMAIGGTESKAKKPVLVEMKRFFPEDGFADIGCYYAIDGDKHYGTSIQLHWTPKKTDDNYAELKARYDELSNRVAILEKLLASK